MSKPPPFPPFPPFGKPPKKYGGPSAPPSGPPVGIPPKPRRVLSDSNEQEDLIQIEMKKPRGPPKGYPTSPKMPPIGPPRKLSLSEEQIHFHKRDQEFEPYEEMETTNALYRTINLKTRAMDATLVSLVRAIQKDDLPTMKRLIRSFKHNEMISNALYAYIKYYDVQEIVKRNYRIPEPLLNKNIYGNWFRVIYLCLQHESQQVALDTFNFGNEHMASMNMPFYRTQVSMLLPLMVERFDYHVFVKHLMDLQYRPLDPKTGFLYEDDYETYENELNYNLLEEDVLGPYNQLHFIYSCMKNIMQRSRLVDAKRFIRDSFLATRAFSKKPDIEDEIGDGPDIPDVSNDIDHFVYKHFRSLFRGFLRGAIGIKKPMIALKILQLHIFRVYNPDVDHRNYNFWFDVQDQYSITYTLVTQLAELLQKKEIDKKYIKEVFGVFDFVFMNPDNSIFFSRVMRDAYYEIKDSSSEPRQILLYKVIIIAIKMFGAQNVIENNPNVRLYFDIYMLRSRKMSEADRDFLKAALAN